MSKVNSIWFAIELRDNPVRNNSIENQIQRQSKVRTTCVFFGTMIIKTLGADVLDCYSDMSNKRTLCEL